MESEAILTLVLMLLAAVGSLSWTPIGRALVERLRRPAVPPDPAMSREVLEELGELRREVAELGERVDFLERLVAKQREAERLPPVR